MNNQKGYTTLIVMLLVAVAALVFGFLVIRQRIKTPPPAAVNPAPVPVLTPEPDVLVIDPTWQTYVNTKYGFQLQYPANFKVGVISKNSVLGTFQVPVRGFHVGPLVLVVLKDPSLKKQAQDYFNQYADCTADKIKNLTVTVKAVTCVGEGGQARYAYIKGSAYDVFVDGYSKGYDTQDFGKFSKETDYASILSTFKFQADQAASPVTTTTLTPPSAVQTFSITADDSGASLQEITVPKGTIVEITFSIATSNVYYGGLDFRSSVVNSGTILTGQSKTISFTANQSFLFTPYWPASNVAKNYLIKVTAQ